MKVTESSVLKCLDDYFDCANTELILSEFNSSFATINGMLKPKMDMPADMTVSTMSFVTS